MGTDPPTHAVDMGHSSEVDYTALEAEHRLVNSQLQNLGAPSKAAVPEQKLQITAQVGNSFLKASMIPVIDRMLDAALCDALILVPLASTFSAWHSM